MITCNLMGGLGNQIFQIFVTIAYSIKTNNKFYFLSIEQLGTGLTSSIRFTYWKTFFAKLQTNLINELPLIDEVIKEKMFSYNELPINKMYNKNVKLHGYFQSYKYFDEYYCMICKIIELEKMKISLLTKLNLQIDYFQDVISVHFRLGDYKNLQHIHPIATYEYYEKALTYITSYYPSKIFTILYFCEDEDIQDVSLKINNLSTKFSKFYFKRAENSLYDWEQLLLMSCCCHNIIANSSFSWWGAYFNSSSDKIVCYPSQWFGEKVYNNIKDLCPPTWVKI